MVIFFRMPLLTIPRQSIKGIICGTRVEEIQDPVTRRMRQLDKLIDELAKGKPLEKVLRY